MINGHKRRHFAAMTTQSTLPSLSPEILDAIDRFGDLCSSGARTAEKLVGRRKLIEAIKADRKRRGRPVNTLSDAEIREVFLANGFTIKDGHDDLKPYVYDAARAALTLQEES